MDPLPVNNNIDMSTYVQFYSDTARYMYPPREKDSLTSVKNYARTNLVFLILL